ncbi:trypsin-like serine protease [uncultured Sulfitobacter sp.]|uniref:trypsin-like serine peptidase n=1 Tax=uncultured Sulfitobacter sp. TaxID=191468 RepID=UPI002617742A|nr:trypsin-like serine protease [uncultured Sulfitobacter sp.]
MGLRYISLAIVLCLTATSGAVAQTKDRLDRRDKLLGFESVGLLQSATGSCTAALITRDVILTAAHCVYEQGEEFTFRAGYRDGTEIAARAAVDVVIAPGYTAARKAGDRPSAIKNDVALIRLDSPMFEVGINPYEITSQARKGSALTVASYGRGRMGALTLERGCILQKRYRGDVVGLDCDATFGSSGAPVFVHDQGRTRIFAVVAVRVNGDRADAETGAVELSKHVPALMNTLRNNRAAAPAIGGAKRIKVGQRSTSAARFTKPGG